MVEKKTYRLTQDMSKPANCEHITINIYSQKGNGLLFGPELYHTKRIYIWTNPILEGLRP